MNQILCCDWLPERARWSYLAHSGLPAVSRKKNFPESHIINPLLTKLVQSRWLDIGLVLFWRVYGPRLRLGPLTHKKERGQFPVILTSHLVNNSYICLISRYLHHIITYKTMGTLKLLFKKGNQCYYL